MNTPNPLVPQGSFLEKGKSHIKITVFAILAIHVVLLGVLLIAGCNKKTSTDQPPEAAGGLPTSPPSPEGWPPPQPPTPPDHVAPPPPQESSIATSSNAHSIPPQPPVPGPDQPPLVTGLSEHTVLKGENFFTLGKKYGVGFKAIAEANPGVNPNRLKIGAIIKIPAPKTSSQTALEGGVGGAPGTGGGVAKTYKVRSGDNLMKIAKAHGVNVKLLRSANNLRTDQIKVGETLKIPAKPTPVAPESLPSVPPSEPVAVPQLPPTGNP